MSPRARLAVIATGGLVLAGAAIAVALVAGGAGAVTPTQAAGAPAFADERATAGLDHVYGGGTTTWTGGGLAVLDCDEDGRPDLYVAGGSNPAALFRNESAVGGSLRFARLPSPTTDLGAVTGAYPLDLDGDGHADLAVLRVGGPVLLRGDGRCGFTPADGTLGFEPVPGWTTAFAATWESDTGLPTLAVGTYVTIDEAGTPQGGCGPHALYRPAGDGRTYAPPGALAPGHCALSMLFSDWDRSGRRDLRVSNDRHYDASAIEQLWRMERGADPREYTADDGWVSLQIWGMGIASHDLTGDGLPEVYLTSQGDNKLQALLQGPAQPMYRDIALKLGANAAVPHTGGDVRPSTAWHPEFDDVNNDGFIDLFVSKGNVSVDETHALRDPSVLLLGQADGTFVEASVDAGITDFARARGATLADLNLDGWPDLVTVAVDEPVRAWRNTGTAAGAGTSSPPAHWLGIRLAQDGANRDAIGAIVEVRVGESLQTHEVVVGGGHGGGRLGPLHIGLGPSASAEIRVTWPDGTVSAAVRVEADRFLEIRRDAAAPVPWTPPALQGGS